jgi:hypothetical protein
LGRSPGAGAPASWTTAASAAPGTTAATVAAASSRSALAIEAGCVRLGEVNPFDPNTGNLGIEATLDVLDLLAVILGDERKRRT